MVKKLNPRQHEILRYINDFYEANRYPAIVTDIIKHFKVSSSAARASITTLAQLGYVDWIVEGNNTRAIFPLWKE